jgi:hypothetical protein
MSHQFTYYALLDDFAQIEENLRRIEPIVILYDRSPTATPRTASALNFKDGDKGWLYFYLIREVDFGAVTTHYVPEQGYWTIECLPSPVIECDGCFFDGKILRSGRMYYTDGDYDKNGQWVWKSEGFRKWATTAFRAAKKCLRRIDRDYIGPAAGKWLETSGGKLVAI